MGDEVGYADCGYDPQLRVVLLAAPLHAVRTVRAGNVACLRLLCVGHKLHGGTHRPL